MHCFNEKLSISEKNIKNNNYNELDKKTKKINQQTEQLSLSISQLNEIYLYINKLFNENIEYLLKEINGNFNKINNKNYKNEDEYNNLIIKIKHKIEEIQNICFIIDENKKNFNKINSTLNKKAKSLKDLYDKYEKESRKKILIKNNDNIKKENNIHNNEMKNKIIDINPNINNYIDNNIEKISLRDSFLIEPKDPKNKIDSYKTKILFKKKNKEECFDYFRRAILLRKNWHETCYVYDDYELYDIYYDIKAVKLNQNLFFNYCFHTFPYNTNIEIQTFLVNDKPEKYIKYNHSIEFKIKLYN